MADILLIDDADNVRQSIAILLSRTGIYNVEEAGDGKTAINLLKEKYYDLIITDVKMSHIDGIEVLKQSKKLHPSVEVIVITGQGTIKTGVKAMKLGAYDYIEKPLDDDEFLQLVKKALEKTQVVREVKYLRAELREKYKFDKIIGKSDAIIEVLDMVAKVSATNSTVLITGESGTGKELVANAIHNNNQRRDKLMLTINCSALSENLIDSELFGHVKGAFTGADKDKRGLFQETNSGTIFLDEIGDIAPATQIRLLRFLENGEIKRVGDTKTIKVDVRLIAATNKNLEEQVANKNFREDLYYRLNVFPIHIKPIRERREDIPLLVNHIVKKYNKVLNKNIQSVSPSAMSLFMDYNWPGNVRELENIIERTLILSSKNIIETNDLARSFSKLVPEITQKSIEKKEMTISGMEKWLILNTLESSEGNQKLSAQKLGISTTTLWRKLKQYEIITSVDEKF